ncbi:MAG: Gfo/Idh/MocA family oxidoreductase [Bacteroidetes bacterium]|nr:Gfo/Idh/MocA family oxidoreductase [Bacteroidota bacterium]MDA1120749.1 Gfo/Idh/MocA family oxidoreductase [Bacteroidota bacterium]
MKRRGFLSTTLKTSGVLAIGSLPAFNIISRKKLYKDRLGIALVGLGSYATNQLGPGLRFTKNCYLAGVVTGSPDKAEKFAIDYNLDDKSIYNYDNYEEIANNPEIDMVYVAMPNNMHAEYTIRGLQAGKHAISEKPMSTTYAEGKRMTDAAAKTDKRLFVGYRLHFDPFHLEMMRLGQKQVYGKVLETDAAFAFPLTDKKRWRLDKVMAGGGPMMDVGIYALQGTIYTLGELPTAVTAVEKTKDKAFYSDIEGTLEWSMKFPSGTKNILRTSYEDGYNYVKARAEQGEFSVEPAYSYNRLAGTTPAGPMVFPRVNQQALQMDAIALSVMTKTPNPASGMMGLRDMFMIDKIYESMGTGKEVSLAGMPQVLDRM